MLTYCPNKVIHENLQARVIYRSLTTVGADNPDVRLQTHEAYPHVHTDEISRYGRKD